LLFSIGDSISVRTDAFFCLIFGQVHESLPPPVYAAGRLSNGHYRETQTGKRPTCLVSRASGNNKMRYFANELWKYPDLFKIGWSVQTGLLQTNNLEMKITMKWIYRIILPGFMLLFMTACTADDHESLKQPAVQERHVPEAGVVSYTFRREFAADVPGTLDLIRDLGIVNIEFSNLFGTNASGLRAMLDERGMVCTSYGVSYDAVVNDIDRVIDEARTLGARYVRVGSIPHDAPFSIDDAVRAVEDFNRAGETLHGHGLSFVYHNHGFEFRPHDRGTLYDYLIEHTDPRYVGFEIDVFWVTWAGHDPVEWINRHPDRFKLVHLKDMRDGAEGGYSGQGARDAMVPLGSGRVDMPALLEAARDSAIEYFYLEDEVDDVMSSVPVSLAYFRSITR
jgi:sugar phosphate isomerase/epimerase